MAEGLIAIASDHAGFDLKESMKAYLAGKGLRFEDMGTVSPEAVDYPDFAAKVARAVSSGAVSRGILICGSGIGMSITANRFPRVRAALCCNAEMARLSREHNDSNVLVLGARFLGQAEAEDITRAWLETRFSSEGRHARRVKKIEQDDFSRPE